MFKLLEGRQYSHGYIFFSLRVSFKTCWSQSLMNFSRFGIKIWKVQGAWVYLSFFLWKECRAHYKLFISARAFTLGAVCLLYHSLVCLNYSFKHISTRSTWVNLLIISQMKPCLPYKDCHLQRIILLSVLSSISLGTTLTCRAGPRPQPHNTKVNKWIEKVPVKTLGLSPLSKRFFNFQ